MALQPSSPSARMPSPPTLCASDDGLVVSLAMQAGVPTETLTTGLPLSCGPEAGGELLVMFFHIIFRIEQNYILCSAVAAWYVLLKCPAAAARKPWHLFLALLSVCCALSDATFAGLPIGLGSTALELSAAAKASITLPFIPVWTVLGVLNALAFVGGKGKSA